MQIVPVLTSYQTPKYNRHTVCITAVESNIKVQVPSEKLRATYLPLMCAFQSSLHLATSAKNVASSD